MNRFQNQVAIVTGASDGIGRATAELLAGEGARVVLVARGVKRLEDVAAGIVAAGGQAVAFAADATRAEAAQAAIELAERRWGRLDALVNTVGGSTIVERPGATIEELPHADWQKLIAYNLDATFHFCRAAVPVMKRARSGKIVNVSSAAGRGHTSTTSCAYVAAKAGVIAFTRKLATELGPWNINVNGTAPALTLTDRLMPFWEGLGEAGRQQVVERIPLRRVGTAVDQARVVCFLCSSDAGFMTGQTLDVNGGQF